MTLFDDKDNYELLSPKFCGMLRSHGRMSEIQVETMNSMRDARISTSKIHGYFATQSGGYRKVGFRRKKMYNEIQKKCRMGNGDADAALMYLQWKETKDLLLYWSLECDNEGALQNLF